MTAHPTGFARLFSLPIAIFLLAGCPLPPPETILREYTPDPGCDPAAVVDEGETAPLPYMLRVFEAGAERFLIAAAIKDGGGAVGKAGLSVRPLFGSEPAWQVVRFPTIADDPLVDGGSTALRAVAQSPFGPEDLLVAGYDAFLELGADPHLTATGYRVPGFRERIQVP